jgi:UDP-2,3-diacylglucosamine pyrophosphatase LpxH
MSPARVPRTLILSDLHLGRPDGACRADAFETLVADFDRVIVNGDIAELHHTAYQADAELELARFRDICHTRGTKLDLIAGNHDPFVSSVRSLSLADGAIYITHGDALHPAVAPWSPHAAVMRSAFEAALAAAPREMRSDAAHFLAAREAAIAEWRHMGNGAHVSTVRSMLLHPSRALSVVRYWSGYAALAAAWTDRHAPEAGTVVIGHSHRAFHRSIAGRQVVNTGSYGFPGRPHAVVIEGTTVRLHAIITRGHFFALAANARSSWPIAFHDAGIRRATATQSRGDFANTPAMNPAASASAARSMDVR